MPKKLWKKGESGNPAGRPKGIKNKLSEDFVKALSDDFAEHGISVIETVRVDAPTHYLKICASMVPKDYHLTSNISDYENLSEEELDERLAIRLKDYLGFDVHDLTDEQLSAISGGASLLLDRGVLHDA